MENIYSAKFIKALFNEMSATYGIINLIASFGFAHYWRHQCIKLATIKPGMVVYDLMTGMGECWHLINRKLKNNGQLLALDFCEEMCRRAKLQQGKMPRLSIELIQKDVLTNDFADNSADCVISSFGLKTFSEVQRQSLAQEIFRILKPGGNFALVEISVPTLSWLKRPYLFYLKYLIPIIGRIFLGNPDNYRYLGVYTQAFRDCSQMQDCLREHELEVKQKNFFFGCATALYGRKIKDD